MKATLKLLIAALSVFICQAGSAQTLKVRPNDTTSLHVMVEPLTGLFSAFYGVNAGKKNMGFSNTFIGYDAGLKNSSGFENVFLGTGAGENNTTGLRNTYIGRWAGKATTGSDNTFLGKEAGSNTTTGSNNTFIGRGAGGFSNGSNNVFLGNFAGQVEAGSHKLYIENSAANASSALIYGEFDNDYLRANGRWEVLSLSTDQPGLRSVKTYDPSISSDVPAVYGKNDQTDYYGIGVHGDGGYIGVLAESHQSGGTGHYYGIQARSEGTNTGANYGIYATAYGGSTNWAGYFSGNGYFSGDVAIGTTTFANGYKLSVNGKIAAEEILVDLSNDWPDYVFKEDYQLNSLDQLRSFIDIKGHLPGVPTAAHVEENGIILGEMNRVLVEKIEELTLYILQQDERINALEEQAEAEAKAEENQNRLKSDFFFLEDETETEKQTKAKSRSQTKAEAKPKTQAAEIQINK